MKSIAVILFLTISLASLKADSISLEERIGKLEQDVALLKKENQQLKESALHFLAEELSKKETERARFVYRTQVLPMVKRLVADFGSKPPAFPREEDITTMIDAYRPFVELMASIGQVANGL